MEYLGVLIEYKCNFLHPSVKVENWGVGGEGRRGILLPACLAAEVQIFQTIFSICHGVTEKSVCMRQQIILDVLLIAD